MRNPRTRTHTSVVPTKLASLMNSRFPLLKIAPPLQPEPDCSYNRVLGEVEPSTSISLLLDATLV